MNKKNVLATVAGREITAEDIESLIKGLDPRAAAQFNSDEGRKSLLEELVNQELLYLDAVENGMNEHEEYKQEVEKAKVNILKQYAMSRLLSGAAVQEGEVIKYYNENKQLFAGQETIRAKHILVDDEDKANDVLNKIRDGLSFEEAARQYSTCPSNSEGGDLGYFPRKSMVPEFENAAFSMEINEIRGPVKTNFGFHLIMVTDKKEGGIKSFDEVKNQIYNQILLKKQQDEYLKKTSELRKKYDIKIS